MIGKGEFETCNACRKCSQNNAKHVSGAVPRRTPTYAVESEGREECCVQISLTCNPTYHVFCTHWYQREYDQVLQLSFPRCVCVSFLVFLVLGSEKLHPVEGSEVGTSTFWKWSEVRNFTLSRSMEQCCCCVAGPHRPDAKTVISRVISWTIATSRNRDLENGMQRYFVHASCFIVESVLLNRQ